MNKALIEGSCREIPLVKEQFLSDFGLFSQEADFLLVCLVA